MIRRSEVPLGVSLPTIDALLSEAVEVGDNFSKVNYALSMAAGIQRTIDWESADQLIASMQGRDDLEDVLAWWQGVVAQGDSEGDLVIGWLVRHHLVDDPEGLDAKQRLLRARRQGWQLPLWMCLSAK